MSDFKTDKLNPLTFDNFIEFLNLYKTKPETEKSWFISYDDVKNNNFNLKAINPNKKEINIIDASKLINEIEI
jgi:type I restriction enzyme M protein